MVNLDRASTPLITTAIEGRDSVRSVRVSNNIQVEIESYHNSLPSSKPSSRPSSSQLDSMLNEANREATVVSRYDKIDSASQGKAQDKMTEIRVPSIAGLLFSNDILLKSTQGR